MKKNTNNGRIFAYLLADPTDLDRTSTYEVKGVFKLLSFDGKDDTKKEFAYKFDGLTTDLKLAETSLPFDINNKLFVLEECAHFVYEFTVQKSVLILPNTNISNDVFKKRD